jgi:hypothetical protein
VPPPRPLVASAESRAASAVSPVDFRLLARRLLGSRTISAASSRCFAAGALLRLRFFFLPL